METITIILGAVIFLSAVGIIFCLRKNYRQKKIFKIREKALSEQLDQLKRENLCFRYFQQEYCLKDGMETRLMGCPPVIRFGYYEYRPVIRIEGSADNWQLILIGAEIYVEDFIGDEDARLVVMRCVNRISAEEYDDFLRQLSLGFCD